MWLNAPMALGFGGPQDWIIILVVALLFFGPKKLPEVGRQLGEAMRELNKLKDELTGAASSLHDEVKSAYEPVVKPYSQAHPISSPTVEAVTTRRVYDQDPHDLMAPVVSEVPPATPHPVEAEGGDKTLPPPVAAVDEVTEKGH